MRNTTAINRVTHQSLISTGTEEKYTIGLINARSIMNKADNIREMMIDNELKCLAITETWHKCNNSDPEIIELCPPGYTFYGVPRPAHKGSRGGGVGLILEDNIKVKTHVGVEQNSFEQMNILLKWGSEKLKMVILYRPPTSKFNDEMFLTELEDVLTSIISNSSERLCILGDFNLHVDDEKNRSTIRFNEILQALGLRQNITDPTHRQGHILDLVISKEDDAAFCDFVVTDQTLSDHFLVTCKFSKPTTISKQSRVKIRALKRVNTAQFAIDMTAGLSLCDSTSPDTLTNHYNETASKAIDKHAPEKWIIPKGENNKAWYSDEIHEERKKRRKFERKYRKTKLEIDKQNFEAQGKSVVKKINEAKSHYYETKFLTANCKETFKLLDGLLKPKQEQVLPESSSDKKLADDFAIFFHEKIRAIRNALDDETTNSERNQRNHRKHRTSHKHATVLRHR